MVKPHHDNEKTPAEVQDRIWELADKIDICMFTTWDGERQRSRPLSARPRRDEHAVHFLVDESGHKNEQVDKYPFVSMAWVDNGGHKYAVVSGKAKLSNDRAKITELWSDWDKAWWDDATDPSIRLLTVTPEDGELWDSPNQAVALAKMAYAAVTGDAPDMGENAKVDL
ncbi:pyridoxamine 5'-phosphate oxidase family protein [Devosia sp. J2-20]|jgi:general stress protein 26|uniref:pyridoxamine 5'-phosphate oxidase family protein n=1 Tax=Devosia TaxID=46913 RepID=UPI0022AF4AA0|nr:MULTISPECIES: pyridoxamine 5'-phosphate oxidase family protein [Devosia]MCZ4345699.1 pyridoxamine 5'-phosphate oxidase family protein [Devosia neptuniae]WDQ99157.1 pyridoxamine 5'-phosphate oxidase family protein [Devosia sp. J2-20]|tara:strand:- start:41 stop:547 length:507 start_codon:yes stop_codon:yes gene_type:complete